MVVSKTIIAIKGRWKPYIRVIQLSSWSKK